MPCSGSITASSAEANATTPDLQQVVQGEGLIITLAGRTVSAAEQAAVQFAFADLAVFMQAVLWQVVDAMLKKTRQQFAAELDAFWDARSIYNAQLEAQQV